MSDSSSNVESPAAASLSTLNAQPSTAGLKPGWKTTEFWITVLVIVSSFLSSIDGVLPPKWAAIVAAISAAIYKITRLILKFPTALVDAAVGDLIPGTGNAPTGYNSPTTATTSPAPDNQPSNGSGAGNSSAASLNSQPSIVSTAPQTSPSGNLNSSSGATSLGTIALLIGFAFAIVSALTLLPGCSFIQSHETQFAQTGELLATKAATIAGEAVLSAAVSSSDGTAKANYLDSLAQGIRSQAPSLISSDTLSQLVGIWTPSGSHWQTLGDQLADAYTSAPGTPAQKLESIAQGLNVAAQTQRDTASGVPSATSQDPSGASATPTPTPTSASPAPSASN